MFSITIDGRTTTAKPGTTILKAAKSVGIEIPTFCCHEKLDLYGGCRLCLVEVDQMPKLQLACATSVCEGMKVLTNSPRVVKARKGVLEFLLINHPIDCPTCDKGGECELQNYVFRYGSDRSRFNEKKKRFIVDEKSAFDDLIIGPQIVRNMNRCIMCTRCIRFIKQIAGENDLGGFKRGTRSEINSLPEIPIRNQYAGNVTEICPVGALTSKAFRYKIRFWETKQIESICPFCADGCNLTLWVKNEKIYRVTSRRNDRVDEGFICDRGRFGYNFVNHPDRLKSPLMKKNDKLVPVSWEEALETIGNRLQKIKMDFGDDSVAGVGSTRCTNEDNYVFFKFFRTMIGTKNIAHRVDLKNPCSNLSDNGLSYGMANTIEDIEKARLIFILGCDLNVEHPIIALRVRKAFRKNNALVIVANPKQTKLGDIAQYELIYRNGTEVALLNGIMNWMIQEKIYRIKDERMVDLRNWLKDYELDKMTKIFGISEEKIRACAKLMAEAESLSILSGRESVHHYQSIDVVNALDNLLLLTGKSDQPQSGINILQEDNNSIGACDVFSSANVGAESSRSFGLVSARLNFRQILEEINAGKIKALYIMGNDPVRDFPDRKYVEGTFAKLDFLVIQDIFLSQTAKLADVVLPGASFAEKDGTFTNCEGRVQKNEKAFNPLFDSKADWEIICELASYLGYEFGYTTAKQITEEISEKVSGYSGLKFEKIPDEGGIREKRCEKDKTEFKKADYQELSEEKEYPFILMTGNTLHHFGSLTQKSENIDWIEKEGFCLTNPEDAKNLEIENGDLISLESPSGKIEIKVRIDPDIQKEAVFIPVNFDEIKFNILMDKDKKVDRVKINKE
jgi:NADH-quinone oxidoreductase chain G